MAESSHPRPLVPPITPSSTTGQRRRRRPAVVGDMPPRGWALLRRAGMSVSPGPEPLGVQESVVSVVSVPSFSAPRLPPRIPSVTSPGDPQLSTAATSRCAKPCRAVPRFPTFSPLPRVRSSHRRRHPAIPSVLGDRSRMPRQARRRAARSRTTTPTFGTPTTSTSRTARATCSPCCGDFA